MGERLREVADEPAALGVVLLRDEAEVVTEPEQPLVQLDRIVVATLLVEDGGEPERAREEHALAGREAVDVRVLLVGAVALDESAAEELGLDRANRADDALVGRGEEPDERDQEAARVEAIRAEELREGAALGVEPLAQHLVLDLLPHGLPAVERPVATEALDRLDGTVERDPGHDLRVREVPSRPAHFPDPLVGLAPAGLEPVEDPAGQAPRSRRTASRP